MCASLHGLAAAGRRVFFVFVSVFLQDNNNKKKSTHGRGICQVPTKISDPWEDPAAPAVELGALFFVHDSWSTNHSDSPKLKSADPSSALLGIPLPSPFFFLCQGIALPNN